jgi:hypothetical protein
MSVEPSEVLLDLLAKRDHCLLNRLSRNAEASSGLSAYPISPRSARLV